MAAKKHRSQQSRVLRRRVFVQTVVVWAVYSAVFVALAAGANTFVVPEIAGWVVDNTATTLRYDPQEYLENYTVDELLDSYLADLDSNKISYKFEEIYDVEDAVGEGGDDASGGASDSAVVASTSSDWADKPVGRIVVYSQGTNESGINYLTGNATVLTPYFLAEKKAKHDFSALASKGGEWQVIYENSGDENGDGSFEARELSLYNSMKRFKLPAAIIAYLAGCLIIVFVEMNRVMRYFDEISGAVGTMIANRDQPVILSRELSLAQDELNRIRLEALNDERVAKSAEHRKNELVAYLAHDIRTPLTSIIGYLSLLDESPDLPKEQRTRFVRTAFLKAESLEGMVNEFFEITRYNLQSIPLERSWVNVSLMLHQIADEFFPQASERDVSICVEVFDGACGDAGVGVADKDASVAEVAATSFFVDADKLARALGNVLRNAIAYADKGTAVKIAAKLDGGRWVITVTDRGREISAVHLESIFEKFFREDAARGTNDGGAGLGLAIAKEIVVAHGGTISATSENGTTVFTVEIPESAHKGN